MIEMLKLIGTLNGCSFLFQFHVKEACMRCRLVELA